MKPGARAATKAAPWLLLSLLAAQALAQAPEPRLRLSDSLAQVPAPLPDTGNTTHWTSAAERWQPGSGACAGQSAPDWDRLTLGAALASTLCQSPSLRQALADVAEQSAGVELADIASNPRWSASAEYSGARNFNSSGSSGRTLGASLGLGTVRNAINKA